MTNMVSLENYGYFHSTEFLYERKFEKFTCSLFLVCFRKYCSKSGTHNTLMAEQFQSLKNCNFDPAHFGEIKKKIPAAGREVSDI